MKKKLCCPALELFHCLPLWKTVLFVSSRAFSLSTPTFLLSTPMENSEAAWKKATKCNKIHYCVSEMQCIAILKAIDVAGALPKVSPLSSLAHLNFQGESRKSPLSYKYISFLFLHCVMTDIRTIYSYQCIFCVFNPFLRL